MRRGGLSMFDGFEDGGMGTSSGHMAATKRPVLLPDTIANLPKKAGYRYFKNFVFDTLIGDFPEST